MNTINLINHPTLGELAIYGVALHTEQEVEYTIYYSEDGYFIAVPSDVDITTVEVNELAVTSVDYERNHNVIAQHYKGGKYLISGNVYDPINGEVLVDYASIKEDVVEGDYLRPHDMFTAL